MGKILICNDITKKYGDRVVLDKVNLKVSEGEVVSIIGPSGAGKSTLLRIVAGLENIDGGEVTLFSREKTKSRRGSVGFVFQDFNLFSHLSVINNLTVPLILVKRLSKNQAQEYAIDLLRKVNMEAYANRFPSNLSGGQKQRVAIVRALAMSPDLMVFDEPTSALDIETIDEVVALIKDLILVNTPSIIVTHEMSFARQISNRIVFLDMGKIVEEGRPEIIFGETNVKRTKEFIRHYFR